MNRFAMKLAEIRRAIDEDLRVHWQNQEHEAIQFAMAYRYFIRSKTIDYCIDLTWAMGCPLQEKGES